MDKSAEYKEWLRYADDDINTARLLNNAHKKSIHIICFHAQQAAEKYLKAFLVYKEHAFEKTHDLLYINKLCVLIDAEFENMRSYCLTLNPYAVVSRYPSELELIEEDASIALEAAEAVREFVYARIKT